MLLWEPSRNFSMNLNSLRNKKEKLWKKSKHKFKQPPKNLKMPNRKMTKLRSRLLRGNLTRPSGRKMKKNKNILIRRSLSYQLKRKSLWYAEIQWVRIARLIQSKDSYFWNSLNISEIVGRKRRKSCSIKMSTIRSTSEKIKKRQQKRSSNTSKSVSKYLQKQRLPLTRSRMNSSVSTKRIPGNLMLSERK